MTGQFTIFKLGHGTSRQVSLKIDVVNPLGKDFQRRASAQRLTLPGDFASAVAATNISDLVNNVGAEL